MKKLFKLAADFEEKYIADEIIEGMSKSIFACAWASWQEEQGISLGPGDIMEKIPNVPIEAKRKAVEIVYEIEQANQCSLVKLYYRAAQADGAEVDPENFGYYLGLQALGTGSRWFDSHKEFPLKVPYTEFYWHGESWLN